MRLFTLGVDGVAVDPVNAPAEGGCPVRGDWGDKVTSEGDVGACAGSAAGVGVGNMVREGVEMDVAVVPVVDPVAGRAKGATVHPPAGCGMAEPVPKMERKDGPKVAVRGLFVWLLVARGACLGMASRRAAPTAPPSECTGSSSTPPAPFPDVSTLVWSSGRRAPPWSGEAAEVPRTCAAGGVGTPNTSSERLSAVTLGGTKSKPPSCARADGVDMTYELDGLTQPPTPPEDGSAAEDMDGTLGVTAAPRAKDMRAGAAAVSDAADKGTSKRAAIRLKESRSIGDGVAATVCGVEAYVTVGAAALGVRYEDLLWKRGRAPTDEGMDRLGAQGKAAALADGDHGCCPSAGGEYARDNDARAEARATSPPATTGASDASATMALTAGGLGVSDRGWDSCAEDSDATSLYASATRTLLGPDLRRTLLFRFCVFDA